jgi:hypothetical protein
VSGRVLGVGLSMVLLAAAIAATAAVRASGPGAASPKHPDDARAASGPLAVGPVGPAAPDHSSAMHDGKDELGLAGLPVLIGNLGARDQVSDGRQVQVSAELGGSPGWVVVQRDVRGKPGPILGTTRILNGEHGAPVPVPLTAKVSSGRYWATLHRDLGKQRVYEFPGPDVVAEAAGRPLTRAFTLTVR